MQASALYPETTPPDKVFRYALGPFALESEILLPELRSHVGDGRRRIRIQVGSAPTAIADGVEVDRFCLVSASEYLLDIPSVARFHVSNGSTVRVQPHPGAAAADIRLYLLGSVFGALCHQSGYLPLHASAVESRGRVTAFLGHSGAGKSTLAAFLARRGFPIVSDDICLLDRTSPHAAAISVIPLARWLKLWRPSIEVLGETPEEEHRVLSKDDKFRVYLGGDPTRAAAEQDPQLSLANLVLIERPESSAAQASPMLEPLDGSAAIVALMQMTYLAYIPERNGGQAGLFRSCGEVLNHTRAHRLTAPLGWDRMGEVLDLLERTLLGPPPEVAVADPLLQV